MQSRAILDNKFHYFRSKLKMSSVVLYYVKLCDLPIPDEEEGFAFHYSKFELGKECNATACVN